MSASHDFWLSCGHHLLDRDATGKLLVTDECLKAYLSRPELMPPPEACSAARGLHTLLLDPWQPIAASRVAAIADADTRENWQTMIAWRDHLVRYCSLEAAYLEIARRSIDVIENVRGEPLYPLLAMNADGVLRLKPQNLIAGLPIRQVEAVN